MRTIILQDNGNNDNKIQFTITKSHESLNDDSINGKKRTERRTGKSGDDEEKKPSRNNKKSTGDDDAEEGENCKKKASPSKKGVLSSGITTTIHTFFGQGDGYELYGEWKNSDDAGKNNTKPTAKEENDPQNIITILLDCRYKLLQKQHQPAAATATAATKHEDDDDGDFMGKVDYNELIALHEDAGLPVQEVRKRYRNTATKDDAGDNIAIKRTKSNDDDEIDGF